MNKQNKPKLFSIITIILVWTFLYRPNLSRYAFGGDSSELVTAMTSWGIAHPPGYPLLMLLGNIFVRIFPYLNLYGKLSLLSALFTLGTSITLFLLLNRLFSNFLVSLIGALFYFTLFPVWLYGIVPEVFALANFLVIWQIYLLFALYFEKNKNPNKASYLFLFFLSIGLSISHHHLFVLFLPSYYYLIKKRKQLKLFFIKNKLVAILGLLLGFSFYIYVPLVSYLETQLDIENAKTPAGFFRLITRSSYGVFKAYAGSGGYFSNRILDVFSTFIFLIIDFKPLGIFFVVLGIIYFFKRHQKVLLNFFLINALFLILFYFYTNFFLTTSFSLATYERFLTFFYLILTVFLAAGMLNFWLTSNQIISRYTNKRLIKALGKIITVILVGSLFFQNVAKGNPPLTALKQTKDFKNLGEDILNTLPKNSLLLPQTDHSFFLPQHLMVVNNLRRDVTIIPLIIKERDYLKKRAKKQNPQIFLPEKQENFWKEFLEKNHQRKIFIFSDKPSEEGLWVPYGLLWKYYPDVKQFKKERNKIININVALWHQYRFPSINRFKKDILFLNAVNNQYRRQFWAYINFLSVSDKPLLARQEADLHFDKIKDDFKLLISYLNLKLVLLECDQKSKFVAERARKYKIADSTDYLPLINYYKYCQKDKKTYNQLQEEYLNLKKREEVPLEKI